MKTTQAITSGMKTGLSNEEKIIEKNGFVSAGETTCIGTESSNITGEQVI